MWAVEIPVYELQQIMANKGASVDLRKLLMTASSLNGNQAAVGCHWYDWTAAFWCWSTDSFRNILRSQCQGCYFCIALINNHDQQSSLLQFMKKSQKGWSTAPAFCQDAKAQKLGISCICQHKCLPLVLMWKERETPKAF